MVKLLSHYRKVKAERYLGEEMKLKVYKEYFRWLKNVFNSKLNVGNLVQGVNTWAASVLRYSAAFVSWRKCELQAADRKTRKSFTIYGGLHRKSDVDRLYRPGKDGRKGLIATEDCVETVCKNADESIDHVFSDCNKLAQKDYK